MIWELSVLKVFSLYWVSWLTLSSLYSRVRMAFRVRRSSDFCLLPVLTSPFLSSASFSCMFATCTHYRHITDNLDLWPKLRLNIKWCKNYNLKSEKDLFYLFLYIVLTLLFFPQLFLQHVLLPQQCAKTLGVLAVRLLLWKALAHTFVSMQLLLLLQQTLYLLPFIHITHQQPIRQSLQNSTLKQLKMWYRCGDYSLLFADWLAGLKAVGLPISFHDPKLSLQFGYLCFCFNRKINKHHMHFIAISTTKDRQHQHRIVNNNNITCAVSIHLTDVWARTYGWSASRHGDAGLQETNIINKVMLSECKCHLLTIKFNSS